MKLKPFLAMTATAALLSSTALAQRDAVIQSIVDDLVARGYSHIEIKRSPGRIKVEARGAEGEIEQVYDTDGALRKEEELIEGVETERTFDANGNLVKEEVEHVDDDDDDDDSDDDDSDDDDDDGDDDDDDGDDGDDDGEDD